MQFLCARLWRGFLNCLYEASCPLGLEHLHKVSQACAPPSLLSSVCELCTSSILASNPRHYTQSYRLLVLAAMHYRHSAQELVRRFKWEEPSLAPPLAELIEIVLKRESDLSSLDYVVPVPSLPGSQWSPSGLLARELGGLLGKPYATNLLVKSKETSLYRYGKQQRKHLLSGAYTGGEALIAYPARCSILLVDDLLASGGTLEACAACLWQVHPDWQIRAATLCASAM